MQACILQLFSVFVGLYRSTFRATYNKGTTVELWTTNTGTWWPAMIKRTIEVFPVVPVPGLFRVASLTLGQSYYCLSVVFIHVSIETNTSAQKFPFRNLMKICQLFLTNHCCYQTTAWKSCCMVTYYWKWNVWAFVRWKCVSVNQFYVSLMTNQNSH